MSQVEVAIAILHRNRQFLMQLRDDIPGIVYPGHWGLFGGHIEPGENSDIAVRRELLEEIGYAPPRLTKVGYYDNPHVIRHVYEGALTVDPSELVLMEGWDMDLLTPDDIRRGDRYSVRAAQVRPLAKPPQQILLSFISQQL
ncbi:NUDIX hydrolase [Leptolyngbya sp. FACHB-36]|uniref:NUDIX hydrolase n=1 Tax=Leptolyngbya sp. FACHB-36 TaxID=2692808 RepID=UPI0016807024|nr:NUDIX hydrolase [Leptolyngbya sp. FACHB-36]MBD2022760.1 NUDIX hydrolase [Leptolyngbya sp. FACHB-36]